MDVKELLRRAADDLPVDHQIPVHVATRARRRRTRNGVLAGVVGVALLVGVGFGVRGAVGLFDPVAKETPASPTPWPGIWPQATRAEAEAAQAAADAHNPGVDWQLNGEEVVERYVNEVLQGTNVELVINPTVNDPGPLEARVTFDVTVTTCPDTDTCMPTKRVEALVTIDRLLRPYASGIWFVTDSKELPPRFSGMEAEVQVFAEDFLEARYLRDDRAHDFLSPIAEDQYHTGEGGLELFGAISGTHVQKIEPSEQDANLYEVTVFISKRPTEAVTENVREVLLIGPDHKAEDHNKLIVHSATRIDGPTGAEAEAIAFVGQFMEARIAGPDVGPGAESFLSPEGKAMYDGTDRHGNDLYLYGYPWDDPDLRFTGFAVILEEVGRGGREGSYKIAVNIERFWPEGDREPPASITEILIVGPGQDLEGNDREFVVLSSEWVDV